VEHVYARALGEAELGAATVEVRTIAVQKASLDAEAAQQLALLRSSLSEGGDMSNGIVTPG